MDHQRRQLLLQLVAAGWVAGTAGAARAADPARSIVELRGEVLVNGALATGATTVGPNDSITTGPDAQLVAVVGADAFLVRERTQLELSLGRGLRQGLRLVTGALLSVFGERRDEAQLVLRTPVATIGIRGTAVYVETQPERDYVCTCYGAVELARAGDPAAREHVAAQHHAPRYVGSAIGPAPMLGHHDLELVMLEGLVGRRVPFDEPSMIRQTPARP